MLIGIGMKDSARSFIREIYPEASLLPIDASVSVHLIWNRARRTSSRFLDGQLTMRRYSGIGEMLAGAIGFFTIVRSIGELRPGSIGLREIKRGCKVTADRAPPVRNVRLAHGFTEARFQEP